MQCWENVGRNRFVECGRLSSGGRVLKLPCSRSNRSWLTVAFFDFDSDGDPDFFPSFGDGPDSGQILLYRNVTREHGGQLTFTRVGLLQTTSGVPLAGGAQAGGWFPSIAFAPDWDGDGTGPDALVGSNHRCWLYRGLGSNGDGSPRFADAVAVQAAGKDIELINPRFDCADVDGDGDLDLFAGTQPGAVHFFKNIGTRTKPELAPGAVVAWSGKYLIGDAHSGVKVADFDGDGLLDVVSGRFWERTELNAPNAPRDFGGFWRNTGSRTAARFERQTRNAPFTEQFQMCDAVRQNGVRAVDWNDDGRLDLLAGDTDGFVWFFRNRAERAQARAFPVFDAAERLSEGESPQMISGVEAMDWSGDGRVDLLTGQGHGGSGLRFYARDWIDDRLRTRPLVALGRLETKRSSTTRTFVSHP